MMRLFSLVLLFLVAVVGANKKHHGKNSGVAPPVCALKHEFKPIDTSRTDQVTFFTHIPKAGGRAVSYRLNAAYSKAFGPDVSFWQSRPASIMLNPKGKKAKKPRPDMKGNKCNMRTTQDFAPVKLAFSHDRPDVAFNKLSGAAAHEHLEIPNYHLVTFLRDVHSQRDSMVNKYITSRLRAEMKKRGGKGAKNKPTYADWVYLDGKDVPLEEQTYYKPMLSVPQKIGVQNLDLEGGRNYQLSWVARGRDNTKAQAANECGGNGQEVVQTCPDDKLLTQAKNAILEGDYTLVGLLHRFEESMCLFHYYSKLPYPDYASVKCKENMALDCLRQNFGAPTAVCPDDESNVQIHLYKNAGWEDMQKLLQKVEKPELEFLEWYEQYFDGIMADAKKDIKCQIANGLIDRNADWLGKCWD